MEDFYGSLDIDLPEDTIYKLSVKELIDRIVYCAVYLDKQTFKQVHGYDSYTHTTLSRKKIGPLRHILMNIQDERSRKKFAIYKTKQDQSEEIAKVIEDDSVESFNHYHEEIWSEEEYRAVYGDDAPCFDDDDEEYKLVRTFE